MIFFVALRKELLEQWRSYRMLITGAVLLIFGLLSPLTAKFTPELMKLLPNGEEIAKLIPSPTAADAVAQYLKNSSQFGVVLALLMTMGTVAQEKEKGTAALMLSKPLPRSVFLWAKFAALGLTFVIGIAIAGGACYYYTLILFEALDIVSWVLLNGLLLIFILVFTALTLLCSTLTRSQVVAGGLAFVLVIMLSSAGAVPKIGEMLPGELLAWGGRLVAGSKDPSWFALWTSVGIIIAALVGAWGIFERQEL